MRVYIREFPGNFPGKFWKLIFFNDFAFPPESGSPQVLMLVLGGTGSWSGKGGGKLFVKNYQMCYAS